MSARCRWAIQVQPNGAKLWRFAYRFEGKQKLLSGGPYPQLSLLAARAWRDEMKQQLALGLDPSEERRQERAVVEAHQNARVRNTFEQVAREWLEIRLQSWTPRYAALVTVRLEADIFPVIGQHDIARITPRQILDAIRKIEARGAIEMARRVKTHCSEISRYAIPDGRCETDPCRDLNPAMSKPRPVAHRAKVQARDLPVFFAKLNADKGERLSHLALRWTMLTMVRTQETRFAEWTEFEGLDGPEPMWRLSPERMKMRAGHLVPLPPQAIDILDMQLRQLTRLSRIDIEKELADVQERIKEYESILASDKKLREVIKAELADVKEEFATPRVCAIGHDTGEMALEDLVDDKELVRSEEHTSELQSH